MTAQFDPCILRNTGGVELHGSVIGKRWGTREIG